MFEGLTIHVTLHAFDRFNKRIDPTATREQLKQYVRESLPSQDIINKYPEANASELLEHFDYGIRFHYRHVIFVLAKPKSKGSRAVRVITCYT